MKTTKELLDESRERSKTRFAERKEIEERAFTTRIMAREINEKEGNVAMATVTFEAMGTAEQAIHKVDQSIERLEHLRLELIQISIGERWRQTERPPQLDDLARELGELAALLKVREIIARKVEPR